MLVMAAFTARGLPASEIEPGVNVLTLPAWNHLGRRVVKDQKGVCIPVFRPADDSSESRKDESGRDGDAPKRGGFFGTSRVYHVCQTVPFGEPDPDTPPAIGAPELGDAAIKGIQDREASERELTTKAGVARAVLRVADDSGLRPGSGELDDIECAAMDDSGVDDVSFAFQESRLPAEIVEALEGEPVGVRALFSCGSPGGGGSDTMAKYGADWMVQRARERVLRSADSVVDRIRVASSDPRGEMLAAIHDLRGHAPRGHLPQIELVPESDLVEGAYFEIGGDSFAVYMRDGVLRAGNGSRSFNLDRVECVPVDAGTLDRDARVSPESIAAPIPF